MSQYKYQSPQNKKQKIFSKFEDENRAPSTICPFCDEKVFDVLLVSHVRECLNEAEEVFGLKNNNSTLNNEFRTTTDIN